MIQMHHVTKTYPRPGGDRLTVLDGIDFTVAEGEFVALAGPSGSGKTTLMNLLGLLDQADAGDYRLDGRSVAELSEADRARLRNRTVGFVFQQFHLLPRTTALENVLLPMLYAEAVDDPHQRAAEALCRVGLHDRLEHMPDALSGGQQQRVAIARALVNRPRLILADEPTGNLDAAAAEGVLDLFDELHGDGATLVVITHDPDVARRARRVVRIDGGRLMSSEALVEAS